MHPFELYLPTKLIFGKNSIEKLPEIMKPYKRILLTYGGGSIRKLGVYAKIKQLLSDKEITELSGIAPNPKVDSAREGVKLAREHKCEVILAAGGGSVIDLSKPISLAVSYDGDPWDLVLDLKKGAELPCLPLASILTTAATGSEYDTGAVISNPETNEKLPVFAKAPFASLLDPEYTSGLSAFQTASGSADIMSHTFESYLVKEGCTLTDGLCEAMLRTVIKNAPIAIKEPDNYEARAELMQAASFGCCGLVNAGMTATPWVCHGIEHEISAYTDITHGAGLAVITPHWMRYSLNAETAPRFAQYGRNVWGIHEGSDIEIASKAIDKTSEFFKSLGLPSTLSEMGVSAEHFEDMAVHLLKHWVGDFKKALRPLGKDDIVNILKASF